MSKKKKQASKKKTTRKAKPKSKAAEVIDLIQRNCKRHLNEEYARLGREMAEVLLEEDPHFFDRGQAKSWACGVAYVLGRANFLSDPNFEPSMTLAELCKKFGVSPATGANKAKAIRQVVSTSPLDGEWMLSELRERNPLLWMVNLREEGSPRGSGVMIDARELPPQLQYQLAQAGLIPMPEGLEEPEPAEASATQAKTAKCGLCGKKGRLMKTPCCQLWICDDHHTYVPFSFGRNSCARNHDRYTLCSYHHNEGHSGHWKECQECRGDFDTEMYVWYATNEYNFEKLEDPPSYEPTRCHKCAAVIALASEAHQRSSEGYTCSRCF